MACFTTSAFAQTYSADYQKLRNNKSSYVWMNDSTVENAEFVNMVLCYVKNTGADLSALAGAGPFHAQIDAGKCESSSVTDTSQSTADSGGSIQTQSFVVDSNVVGDKLDVKLWFPTDVEDNGGNPTAYAVAARVSLPLSGESTEIGIDRLDYILYPASVDTLAPDYNPNNAVAYGALVAEKVSGGWRIKQGERILETQISNIRTRLPGGINASDSTKASAPVMWFNLVKEGSGASATLKGYSQVEEWDSTTSSPIFPSYAVSINNSEYLKQSLDQGGLTQCFDRSSSTFSTWAYNLYNQSTGELVKRNSSYRIKYNGRWGNYHQWGVWLGQNVSQDTLTFPLNVDVDIGTSSLVAGQLIKRDGKLVEVKSIVNTLEDLKGVPLDFYYWNGNSNQSVQIAWNGTGFEKLAEWNTLRGNFSPVDPVNGNQPSYSFPVDIANWQTIGLWSRSTNGEVKINGVRNGNTYDYSFANTTKLISFVRKELKGSDLAALEGKQFNCLNNCPTISIVNGNISISGSNVNEANDPVKTYKLANGLLQSLNGQETYTYPETVPDSGTSSNNFWSGQLVLNDAIESATLKSRYQCENSSQICGYKMWSDADLGTHYFWSTGERTWDKSFDLLVSGSPLTLDPQLDVEYVCPSDRTCSGTKKIILNYNGPKQLWGIPNRCVSAADPTRVVDCNSNENKRWVNLFNLTQSPVNASSEVDYVTDLKDRSTKYLILPQGSEEFYGSKQSCSVTLPTEAFSSAKVDVDDIFAAERATFGEKPIDPDNVLPLVVNGVKIR